MSLAAVKPEAPAPIEDSERLHGLDALRGIALLGILWANVRQIFLPWDVAEYPVARGGSELAARLDWWIFHALVDLKFLTLFSLLFGIGFALQSERLHARGASFGAIYLRRVLVLALFGIAHALLLYPAEVLMPYAATAVLLLAMQRLSPDSMLRTGLVLLGITTVWAYQIGSLGRVHVGINVVTLVLLVVSVATLWRRSRWLCVALCALIIAAAAGALTVRFEPASRPHGPAYEYQAAQQQLAAMRSESAAATWPEEFRIRREGSFTDLLRLHAGQYSAVLFYFAILLLWRTLGLFMIGAGLFRQGLLTRTSDADWRRIAAVAAMIGLPLTFLATWLHERDFQGAADLRLPDFLHTLSALPLAAAIAAATFALHRTAPARWAWMRVEAAGRMALTNYVGQSFVMAALAESWGLGLYGRLSGPMLTLLAIAAYALLATLSGAWLARYRMGPLEWLWRCGTYWQWLPNRRLSPDSPVTEPAGTATPSRKPTSR